MAKGPRVIVTLECTEARKENGTPSRYTTTKNKKTTPQVKAPARVDHTCGIASLATRVTNKPAVAAMSAASKGLSISLVNFMGDQPNCMRRLKKINGKNIRT